MHYPTFSQAPEERQVLNNPSSAEGASPAAASSTEGVKSTREGRRLKWSEGEVKILIKVYD